MIVFIRHDIFIIIGMIMPVKKNSQFLYLNLSGLIYDKPLKSDYLNNIIHNLNKVCEFQTDNDNCKRYKCNFYDIYNLYALSCFYHDVIHEYNLKLSFDLEFLKEEFKSVEKFVYSYVEDINKKYNNKKLNIISFKIHTFNNVKCIEIHVKLNWDNDIYHISKKKYEVYIEFIKELYNLLYNTLDLSPCDNFDNVSDALYELFLRTETPLPLDNLMHDDDKNARPHLSYLYFYNIIKIDPNEFETRISNKNIGYGYIYYLYVSGFQEFRSIRNFIDMGVSEKMIYNMEKNLEYLYSKYNIDSCVPPIFL